MSELYTIGSMCSGMEAASVALNPLGFKTLWLSEIDAAPCSVLANHHPTVPNLGDMRKIPALIRDCFVPAPDMLCGGTPCQAFSIAGLRNSLDDERGNLSLIFCETADEIDKRRAADGLLPAVILWENVPGVLSTADNAFGCFLAGLAGEDDPIEPPGAKWSNAGCVYGPKRTVAWRVFDAQYFGVAQRRRRVFVVASAREGFDPAAILFEFDGVRRDSAPSRETGENATGSLAASSGRRGGVDDPEQGTMIPIAPALRQWLNAGGMGRQDWETETMVVDTAPAALSVALRGREGGATAELGDEVAGTLRASTGGGDKAHVLAPIAFDSRQDTVSSIEVFGALSSSSPQAQAVASMAFAQNTRDEVRLVGGDGEISGALAAQPGMKQTTYVAPGGMAVRRLMPVECLRLQGYPDDFFTGVLHRGKPLADGPMYKMIGNSWAVPNIVWIGKRIRAALDRGAA